MKQDENGGARVTTPDTAATTKTTRQDDQHGKGSASRGSDVAAELRRRSLAADRRRRAVARVRLRRLLTGSCGGDAS